MIAAVYPLSHGIFLYMQLRSPSQSRLRRASSPKGRAKGRALPARCTEIFGPGFGGAVDKMGRVRYTIDEKGTTSKAVPQSELRDNRCFGVLAVISYYLPVKQRQ